jgi:hypothetical protein
MAERRSDNPQGNAQIPIGRRAPGEMLQRLSGALTTLLANGVARRGEDDVIELLLNPQEIAEGWMVKIAMYVPVRCPVCAEMPTGSCPRCEAKGSVDELFSAWLALRPGVPDGTVLSPSALLTGMLNPVSFRVRHRDAS